jgi:hypothetical protein
VGGLDPDAPPENNIDEIVSKWRMITLKLRALSLKHNKKVIFTELGYCEPSLSYNCSRINQPMPGWQKIMAQYYEAIFKNFESQDWFEGVFWWNWTPDFAFGGPNNQCMSPQWKPAEDVLRKYYHGDPKIIPIRPTYEPICQCTL